MHFLRKLQVAAISVFLAFSVPVVADQLRMPPCDELASWAGTVDPKDRWRPFAENRRIWLPNAMLTPEFKNMFGMEPLDWSQADIASAKRHWNGCTKKARKSGDKQQHETLKKTRRFLAKHLRNVVRQQARRGERVSPEQHQAAETTQPQSQPQLQPEKRDEKPESAIDKPAVEVAAPGLIYGVDELVGAPPSTEALIVLGTLSRLDVNDKEAMLKREREIGYMKNVPAVSGGYRVLRELRGRGTEGFEDQRKRIDARLAEIKPEVLEALTEEFSQNPVDVYKKRALATRYEKLMGQLKHALPEDEYKALADDTRKARRETVDKAVADAKAKIDAIPPGFESIALVDRVVSETAKHGLDIKQRKELVEHARGRQQMLADQVLNDARENELPALPETLSGMQQLSAISTRMLQGVVQKASRDAIERFVEASEKRLAEIGPKALPEYKEQLAKLPENEKGLQQVNREIAEKKAWEDMDAAVRADYLAAAEARRSEIAKVVERARAQQTARDRRFRAQAIAAGGDPRLVGSEWIDDNKTMKLDFRDEETVFVTALGMKFAGTYKVSRDDVVVTGPHGQIVYTLDGGDKLTGMGAVFRRQ